MVTPDSASLSNPDILHNATLATAMLVVIRPQTIFTLCLKASFASVVYATACLSVCLSVHHTLVLCQNEGMQRDAVFTVRYPNVSCFLLPRMVDGRRPCPGKI